MEMLNLLLSLSLFAFLSLLKVRGHGLGATHFLFGSQVPATLYLLLHLLFLFVLNALHTELIRHPIVDLSRWQLQVLILLS